MIVSAYCRPMACLHLQGRQQQRLPNHRARVPALQPARPLLLSAFPAAGSQAQKASRATVTVVTAKYKMKTRKATAKRFRVTGSGKVKRRSPGKQHINEKKTRARLRKLSAPGLVNDRDIENIRPNMPYAGIH